jgi:hypothetical protein
MFGHGDRSLTLKWSNNKTWCHVELRRSLLVSDRDKDIHSWSINNVSSVKRNNSFVIDSAVEKQHYRSFILTFQVKQL